jgi:ATP synthase subunit 6
MERYHQQFPLQPKYWQSLVEGIYATIAGMIKDNLGLKGQLYFGFLFVLFNFVVVSNLVGLVPYSFTATSHLIVTLCLALMVFIGVNIIGIGIHSDKILCLFLPQGSPLGLAFLLIPIEIVSYVFKPISLAVRLFANMMAGHTLLKVIAGFAWGMMNAGFFLAHLIPLALLVLLMGLELGVALIQAYVFVILSCIYLTDSVNLH